MFLQKLLKNHFPILYYLTIAIFMSLLVTSCYHMKLYGRVEKINGSIYASHALLTPDPKLRKLNDGQRLVVSWVLRPYLHPEKDSYYLECVIYTTKGKRLEAGVKIEKNAYHWEYEMSRERMVEEGAIATYRLAIRHLDREIETFEHKLYKPMIDPDPIESSDELDWTQLP